MNSAKNQFPEAELVLCNFHFKQALRRKLVALRIPQDFITAINVLTVIPISEVRGKGIAYVRSKIDESGQKLAFEAFWRYFISTWIDGYDVEGWNIERLVSAHETAEFTQINRTNNPLERFNRELNEAFPTPHPDMIHFIEVIKRISVEKVEYLKNIQRKRAKPNAHDEFRIEKIPADYYDFYFE